MQLRKNLIKLAGRFIPELADALALVQHRGRALEGDLSYAGEFDELKSLLSRTGINEGYIVDIAASDGVTQSCTLPFFRLAGWRGFAVECNERKFSKLAWAYEAFPDVALAKSKVTPHNVVDLLKGHCVPLNFDLLNLDIDGYDWFVLQSILKSGFRPSVISMEINEKLPPPLFFAVHYNEAHVWQGDHFYGCSAVAAVDLVKPFGYILESIRFNNAMFVLNEEADQANILDQDVHSAYRQGYVEQSDRKELFPWNSDVDDALTMEASDAESYFREFFAPYKGRFDLHCMPQ